jgi:hypothetical protein
MREATAPERRRRGRGVQSLCEISKIRRLDPRDIDLDDFRDLIRMSLFQVPKETSDAFGDRFEEDHNLLACFPRIVPPKMRLDRPVARARRKTAIEDFLDPSFRNVPIRERHEHESHRPGRIDRIERVGRHPTDPPTWGTFPEKSSVTKRIVARSTTAARAGTGEMFRIRWYSVSACQVDAFRRSTPRY